jgi:hypothetical protein
MQRLNIFNQVHKGLRAALYETALLLQQANFTSANESDVAMERIKEVLMLFEEHARKEDFYILKAIVPYEPSVADAFEQEHMEDMELSAELSDEVIAFESLLDNGEREAAGRKINELFAAFIAFNLKHMAKEELVINEILWRYFSDNEILQIQNRIVASTQPWHQDFFSKWMLRGINNAEATSWLLAVERTAPPIVYHTLFNKARQQFTNSRFQQLVESLKQNLVLN